MKLRFLWLALPIMLGIATPAAATDLELGRTPPDFSVKDVTGKTRHLAAQKGKIVVLEWTNHECPFVRKHYDSGNMQRLQKELTAKGVIWWSVISSAPGKQGAVSAEEALAIAKERGAAPSAILLDPKGTIGQLYHAKTTPHLFVIDARGNLAYMGAIDDRPTADPQDIEGARNYVRDAVENLIAGKEVDTPSSNPYGCSIKY